MQRLKIAAAMVATLAAVACGGDDNGAGFTPTDDAQVRVIHASPGAPTLEVLMTDTRIADNLAFGQSSPYQSVQGGDQLLRVNSDFDDQHEELFAVQTPLTAGVAYTIVIAGGDAGIVPIVLTDDNARPPAGQAKLRIMQAASTSDQVDVYVTAPGADLSTATPTFTAVAFGAASSYATLAAGAYQVRITPTGLPDVLVDTGALQLAEGDIRTVVAIESPAGGPPLSAVVLDDTAR